MSDEPGALLDDLGALRRRTRRDGSGYWLPLLLFGVLVLAAPLAYLGTDRPMADTYFEVGPVWTIGGFGLAPLQLFQGFVMPPANPTAVGLYWLLATAVGAACTFFWYRARAARVGVHLRIGTYLWYALGALVAAVIGVPVLIRWTLYELFGGRSRAAVLLSLLVLVIGLAIAVLSARPWRRAGTRSTAERVGLAVGVLITLVGAGNVATLASPYGLAPLFVIAVGLFGLAWMERSRLCGTIAVLFTGAALLANLYDVGNLFSRWGAETVSPAPGVLDNLLLPGAVLIVGGVVALVSHRSAGRQAVTVAPTR